MTITMKRMFYVAATTIILLLFVGIFVLFTSVKSFAAFSSSISSMSGPKPVSPISSNPGANPDSPEIVTDQPTLEKELLVFQYEDIIAGFDTYEEALEYAQNYKAASIRDHDTRKILWDNYPLYSVYTSVAEFEAFDTYEEALEFARTQPNGTIYYKNSSELLYDALAVYPDKHYIHDVIRIDQMPELPRGCEVTSLTMLLNYLGTDVDKMTLADEIAKNTTPHSKSNGIRYAGDPNDGFIGDMKNYSNFGLGVYHKPIFELLKKYDNNAIDITGSDFEDLYPFISQDTPVWVITNTKHQALPASAFEQWVTPNGTIDITYSEHSVLVIGYDDEKIYFVDPLNTITSAPKADFISAWDQMGRQAVTVVR